MAKTEPETSFLNFLRTGEPQSLARVFDHVAPELLRVAQHLTRDIEQAEDVVQQTFLTVIEKGHTFDHRARLVPWMLAIAANHVRQNHRAARRARRTDAVEPIDATQPTDEAARREVRDEVTGAIEGIPNPYRQVLSLHLLDHIDTRAIAKTLGRPLNTVRSQVRRGLDMLRQALPAGLATGAAVSVTTRSGLAAVRSEVLRAASVRPLVTTVATGMSAARIALLLLACVALPLGIWWLDPFGADGGPVDARSTTIAGSTDSTPDREEPKPIRAAAETDSETHEADGPFLEIVDDATGEPAEGAEVVVIDSRTRKAMVLDTRDIIHAPSPMQGRIGWLTERRFRRAQMEKSEQRYTVDATGKVRIHSIEGATIVICRFGDKVGHLPIKPASNRGHGLGAHITESHGNEGETFVVRIAPAETLRAQVVDERGEPVPGVPVSLFGEGGFRFFGERTVATDDEGIAEFQDLADLRSVLGKRRTLRCQVSVPLNSEVETTVDFDALPAEPIQLTVPKTRPLVVRVVDRHDRLEDGITEVRIQSEDLSIGLYAKDGEVRLPHVGTTGRLQLEARTARGDVRAVTVDLGGVGELVATLRPLSNARSFTGQILGADGQPVAERTVSLRFDCSIQSGSNTIGWTQYVETASDGRFELEASHADALTRAAKLNILVHPADDDAVRTAGGILALPPATKRVQDLGPIQLQALDRVAAGVVVDAEGKPLDAGVGLVFRPGEEKVVEIDGRSWKTGRSAAPDPARPMLEVIELGSTGRFAVFGTLRQSDSASIKALAAVHDEGTTPLRPGATDHRIVLATYPSDRSGRFRYQQARGPAAVEGSVRVPKGIDENKLRVHAVRTTPGHAESGKRLDEFGENVEGGYFHLAGLPATTIRIEVWFEGGSAPLVAIDDLKLRGGVVNHDPRLDDIELPAIENVTLTLLDHGGSHLHPLPKKGCFLYYRPRGTSGEKIEAGTYMKIGSNPVRLPTAEPLDIDVVVNGFRHARLRNVSGQKAVHLEQGIPLVLRHGKLPPGLQGQLQVSLIKVRRRGERRRSGTIVTIGERAGRARAKLSGTATTVRVPEPGTYMFNIQHQGRSIRGGKRIVIPAEGSTLVVSIETEPELRLRMDGR